MNDIVLHDLSPEASELAFFTDRIETMDEFIQTPEPDRHTFHELLWIERGEGWHHIDFQSYEIRSDAFFYIAPGQIHLWQVSRRSVGQVVLFTDELLSTDQTHHAVTHTREVPSAIYTTGQQARTLSQLFLSLREEYSERQGGWRAAICALTQLLLVQAQRFHTAQQVTSTPSAATILTQKFRACIEQQFAQAHTVQPYAKALAVTPGHLTEAVREATGLPAGDLIRKRIVLEAKRLLAHTDETAQAISVRLGFNSASYFGRFFQREANATPDGFRRAFRKKYQLPHE